MEGTFFNCREGKSERNRIGVALVTAWNQSILVPWKHETSPEPLLRPFVTIQFQSVWDC